MIPVELVSASKSGKENNISVSVKEMEPGSGESTCFLKITERKRGRVQENRPYDSYI